MNARVWDRIAEDYAANIVSPFDEGTANPIFDELRAIDRRDELTAADLGCGVGSLVPFLAEHFGQVVAVDFSAGMLRRARRRTDAENVAFRRANLTDLSRFRESFDVVVAVNSVLAPSPRTVNHILGEIHSTLRPGGRFVGIFPAMEAVLYHAMLVLERENASSGLEETAVRRAKALCEREKYDFIAGIFDDDGDRQKHYYRFELRHRLHQAGFQGLRFRKVLYPWDDAVSGFECFPGQPRMWDWLVTTG